MTLDKRWRNQQLKYESMIHYTFLQMFHNKSLVKKLAFLFTETLQGFQYEMDKGSA